MPDVRLTPLRDEDSDRLFAWINDHDLVVRSARVIDPSRGIDDLLDEGHRLRLSELHLKADDPEGKAAALSEVLECERIGADVEVGDTLVRFVPGGPQGRPELNAELFL